MQISFNPKFNTSFKQIKLSAQEEKRADDLLCKLTTAGKDEDFIAIQNEIFTVFKKHIDNEVRSKWNSSFYLSSDILQDFYKYFFESLLTIKEKSINLIEFIQKLNTFSPKTERIKPEKDSYRTSLEKNISPNRSSNLKLKDLITEEDIPQYASSPSEEEKEFAKRELKEAISKTKLSDKRLNILMDVATDKSFSEIGREQELSHTAVRTSYISSIAKIQKANKTLPQKYIDIAKGLKSKYKINKSIPEILEILASSARTAHFELKDFETKINTLAKELNLSEEKIANIVLKNMVILNLKPSTIHSNIKKSAKLLKIEESSFIEAMTSNPEIVNYTPEKLNKNARDCAKLLGIKKEIYIQAALKYPSLLVISPEVINNNVETAANNLGISKSQYIKISLLHPNLFYQKPDTILKNVQESSKIFGIEQKAFIKAGLIQANLLFQSPETLDANVNKSSSLLEIPREKYIKLALRVPQLFYLKPETLNSNMIQTADLLGVGRKEFIKGVTSQPHLLYLNPTSLNNNAEKASKIFGIPKNIYTKMAMNAPSIIIQKPETLDNNINNLSRLLGISREEAIKAASRLPDLFYRKPESINQIIETNAKLFGMSKAEYIKHGLKQPILFCLKGETILQKEKLKEFHKKTQGEDYSILSTTVQSTNEEAFFTNTLKCLIRKELGLGGRDKVDLIEILKTHSKKVFKFKLPKHEMTDKFINFVENFFAKNIGSKNYQFIIK